MAVSTKEDLVARISASFGENLSDDNISLLEDLSDTIDSFSDKEDWKTKYEENDKTWRERYTSRFFSKEPEPDPKPEPEPEPEVKKTFSDLFKEG